MYLHFTLWNFRKLITDGKPEDGATASSKVSVESKQNMDNMVIESSGQKKEKHNQESSIMMSNSNIGSMN